MSLPSLPVAWSLDPPPITDLRYIARDQAYLLSSRAFGPTSPTVRSAMPACIAVQRHSSGAGLQVCHPPAHAVKHRQHHVIASPPSGSPTTPPQAASQRKGQLSLFDSSWTRTPHLELRRRARTKSPGTFIRTWNRQETRLPSRKSKDGSVSLALRTARH